MLMGLGSFELKGKALEIGRLDGRAVVGAALGREFEVVLLGAMGVHFRQIKVL